MKGPKAGDKAPDFALAGVPTGTYRLSEQRGRTVVLAFYPGDFTPVCTRQMTDYQENFDTFARTGAVLWGISVDDLEKHERFARARSLGFPLLSDTDGKVSALYDALGLLGTSKRVLIVVDPEGNISYRKDEPLSLTYTEMDRIVALLPKSAAGTDATR